MHSATLRKIHQHKQQLYTSYFKYLQHILCYSKSRNVSTKISQLLNCYLLDERTRADMLPTGMEIQPKYSLRTDSPRILLRVFSF